MTRGEKIKAIENLPLSKKEKSLEKKKKRWEKNQK